MDSDTFKIMRASPEYSEGIAELYQRVYGGKYPILEFSDSETVEKTINSGKYCWFIAVADKSILGSMVGVPDKWNHSFEVGRGVVDKDYRSKHLGLEMFENIMSEAIKHDLVWGFVRNKQLSTLVDRYSALTETEFYLTGYAPGRHKVNERENHLIRIGLNESGKERRVSPDDNPITTNPFIETLIEPFGFKDNRGKYPGDLVIGPERGGSETTNSGEVLYDYSESDNSIIINHVYGGYDTTTIEEFLGRVYSAEYIELSINPVKEAKFRELRKLGFVPCIYLPGWFLDNEKRYDTIKMAKHWVSTSPDETIEEAVKRLSAGFEDI